MGRKLDKIFLKGVRFTEMDWRGIIALTLVLGAIFTQNTALITLASSVASFYFGDKSRRKREETE